MKSDRAEDVPPLGRERVFQGLGVAPGIALGTAWVSDDTAPSTPEYLIEADGLEAESQRLKDAVALATKQLKKLKVKSQSLPPAAAEELGYLLDARLQMLAGSRLIRTADKLIAELRLNAEAAVRATIAEISDGFSRMGDAYLAARGEDVREVGERLIRCLMATPYVALKHLPEGCILIAADLTPADTALLDPKLVLGFATETGGKESHTAIMARSLGVPAILGIAHLVEGLKTGDPIILDGHAGKLIVHPTPETRGRYEAEGAALKRERKRLSRLRDVPAITLDGFTIGLNANIELPRDLEGAHRVGAEGVGLLRTEFLYMNRDHAPDEDEQYEFLREVVEGMEGSPVTIRTIDIGGDKLAPALREQIGEPIEEAPNPALGVRGVRLSLAHPRLFDTQLAAILRAAVHGPVRILLPMISHIGEVHQAREALERVHKRLKRRKVNVPEKLPPLGVMIEVPGAALSADGLAAVSDFFAIGTNDLTMYTLAIDRGDERVAALYEPLHPAVLRLIQFTVEAGLRYRIPVSICGEIAGDPRFVPLLLGIGVRELSMSAPKLPSVKERIRALSLTEASRRARTIMDQADAKRIGELLDDFIANLGVHSI
jgi:phosphotransferase system enzyme I (PtsI)